METSETKVCKYCGETKPIDAFRLYKGKTRLSKCIACEKADQKKYKSTPKIKVEKVVIKNSDKIMPVHPVSIPKPAYLNSYKIGEIVVDTNPIPNARRFSFEGGPKLFVPSGVSIYDLIKANDLLTEPDEVFVNEREMEEVIL